MYSEIDPYKSPLYVIAAIIKMINEMINWTISKFGEPIPLITFTNSEDVVL